CASAAASRASFPASPPRCTACSATVRRARICILSTASASDARAIARHALHGVAPLRADADFHDRRRRRKHIMVMGATSLGLVRNDLFVTIEQVEQSLERFIAERGDAAALQQMVEGLQQLGGTLKLLQLAGAEL